MTTDEISDGDLGFLVEKALELGAIDAKIITTDDVFVENRVVLKCRGCLGYGKKLTCPPHVPTVDEFRKILKEYRYAMLVKFSSPLVADKDIVSSLYRSWLDPSVPVETKEKAKKFWSDYSDCSPTTLNSMLELEKTAFNAGFTFAVAFASSSCHLCKKCNVENGICVHANMARIQGHAVGINMKKTAAEAGMPIKFPFEGHPEPMAILLID